MSAPPAWCKHRTPPSLAAGEDDKSARHVTIRGLSKRFRQDRIYDNFDLDTPGAAK